MKNIPPAIQDYFNRYTPDIQFRLEQIRFSVLQQIPDVKEQISYGVPAFKKCNRSVLYAAFKNHIGLYPSPEVIELFQEDVSEYKTSKGTIQFPHMKDLPVDLILKIVQYRLNH